MSLKVVVKTSIDSVVSLWRDDQCVRQLAVFTLEKNGNSDEQARIAAIDWAKSFAADLNLGEITIVQRYNENKGDCPQCNGTGRVVYKSYWNNWL